MTELEAKLQLWVEAATKLKNVRELEMSLRKECLSIAFPDGKIGTNNLSLAAGWQLKGVFKLEHKFDEEALDSVLEALAKRNVPVDTLVRIKREPSMREINKLSEEDKLILAEAMITKPSTPTLELVPPKGSK